MVICRSQPRKIKFNPEFPDYSKEKDIVEYQVIEVVKKTGEGDSDFIVEKKVVELSRINRQKFYDEQAKDHTIYNIIDKVMLTSDQSLLHKGDQGIYGDFSKLPLDRGDAYANSVNVEQALSKLDPELVGDDLNKFLKEATVEEIEAFYKNKYGKKPETEGGNE